MGRNHEKLPGSVNHPQYARFERCKVGHVFVWYQILAKLENPTVTRECSWSVAAGLKRLFWFFWKTIKSLSDFYHLDSALQYNLFRCSRKKPVGETCTTQTDQMQLVSQRQTEQSQLNVRPLVFVMELSTMSHDLHSQEELVIYSAAELVCQHLRHNWGNSICWRWCGVVERSSES